ncbi:uncharacterized protein FMAN_10865 [Fusarium mangiferae]|uniref:Uncharacterized protein n=1 Tax=Fusarium mangiferae TaxID=192010 RepID=A0A1L7U3G3_FUSMA|nr:uncharacterized protein FMAN_10865 [Fusarium mangiferae]CVL05274.1 uncharacterized protein FMAN_10865 [Fusarium mangiferae]
MIRNTLVLAALAVTAIAGPCKPTSSSTELLSTTIGSTETSYVETSVTEATSSSESTSVASSIASSDATTTAETTTTSGSASTTAPPDDSCAQSLALNNGEPQLTDKIADCQDLNVVTVSSYEVTQTVYKRGNVIIIPTNAIARRAEGEAATTIFPSGVPAYATYCDSPSAYYEACSELGVTAFTTTIPEPTTTEVIITN